MKNKINYLKDKNECLVEIKQISKDNNSFDNVSGNKTNCCWSNKGESCLQNNQYEKALYCFNEALKLDSQDIFSIICIASLYSLLNDYEKADKYFNMAEQINCRDTDYLSKRGKHLLDKYEFQKAIDYFDKCLEIDDELALVWMYKSIALSEIGLDVESEICFKKAVELDLNSIDVFDEFLVIED